MLTVSLEEWAHLRASWKPDKLWGGFELESLLAERVRMTGGGRSFSV